MDQSTARILASVLLGLTISILWFHAPPLPALFGAVAAGAVFYWRRS